RAASRLVGAGPDTPRRRRRRRQVDRDREVDDEEVQAFVQRLRGPRRPCVRTRRRDPQLRQPEDRRARLEEGPLRIGPGDVDRGPGRAADPVREGRAGGRRREASGAGRAGPLPRDRGKDLEPSGAREGPALRPQRHRDGLLPAPRAVARITSYLNRRLTGNGDLYYYQYSPTNRGRKVAVSRRDFLKVTAAGAFVTPFGFNLAPAVAQAKKFKIARTTETRSICPYCSVSCGVIVHTRGDGKNTKKDIIHIEGDPDHPVNQGTLCPKGATLKH